MRNDSLLVQCQPRDCSTQLACPEWNLSRTPVQIAEQSLLGQQLQEPCQGNQSVALDHPTEPLAAFQSGTAGQTAESNSLHSFLSAETCCDNECCPAKRSSRSELDSLHLSIRDDTSNLQTEQKYPKNRLQLQLPIHIRPFVPLDLGESPSSSVHHGDHTTQSENPTLTSNQIEGDADKIAHSVDPRLLTPPEELVQPFWNHHQNLQSHVAKLSNLSGIDPIGPLSPVSRRATEEDMSKDEDRLETIQSGTSAPAPPRSRPQDALADAVNLAAQIVGDRAERSIDRRVVVQVLPSPLNESDMPVPLSLWQALLDRLLASRPLTPRWISAIHAVPRNYPADDIPSSTPGTPSISNSGEASDYFASQRIVHTAAFMEDQYDLFSERSNVSPGLASSPQSVDVALYQRLIPPSTAKEVNELFDVNSPSALIDRLTELGRGGCLLFFYPTKAGAETFKREYLGRGLEGLIRSALLSKGLPLEACGMVAKIASLEAIPHFHNMDMKLRRFVQNMSRSTVHDGTYSVPSGGKAYVELPAKAWKTWWVRQEEARVNRVIDHYLKLVTSRIGVYREGQYTSRGITREITNGLFDEPDSGAADLPPIEVGVFVIKRND